MNWIQSSWTGISLESDAHVVSIAAALDKLREKGFFFPLMLKVQSELKGHSQVGKRRLSHLKDHRGVPC